MIEDIIIGDAKSINSKRKSSEVKIEELASPIHIKEDGLENK